MPDSTETLYYISAENLKQGFLDGTYKFCRPEWYIRKDESDIRESVAEKKVALAQPDESDMTAVMVVRDALIIHRYNDESGKEIREIISGNTRVRSILEVLATNNPTVTIGSGKDGKTFIITGVDDIPFTLVENLTLESAIAIQTDTNGYTREHTALDIALMVTDLKPKIEAKLKAEGMKDKAAAGVATTQLMTLFKKSNSIILEGYQVVTSATEKMMSFIKEGKIAIKTAAVLLAEKNKKESVITDIDVALDALFNRALVDAKATGTTPTITKTMVINYIKDLKAAASSEGEGEGYGSGSGSGGGSGGGSGSGSGSGSGTKTPKPEIDSETFIKKSEAVFTKIASINTDELTVGQLSEVNTLNHAMLDFISNVSELMPVGDNTIQMHKTLRDLYLQMADASSIASEVEQSDKTSRNKLLSVISKADKVAKTLAAITNGEVVGGTEEVSDEVSSEAVEEAAAATTEEVSNDASAITVEDDDMVVTLG